MTRPIPKLFVICYAGKGVPLERRWEKNMAVAISRNFVPTMPAAVQMYSGTLPTEQTFDVDPLEQQLAKKDIRKRAFKNYFPSFDVIFLAISNGNDVFFRDAISILHTANKTPFSPIMFNFSHRKLNMFLL